VAGFAGVTTARTGVRACAVALLGESIGGPADMVAYYRNRASAPRGAGKLDSVGRRGLRSTSPIATCRSSKAATS
jgi:hypothetical protein